MHAGACDSSDIVGGSPAIAVGYDLERAVRFRICLRFPAGVDWLSDAPNFDAVVSESAPPSGTRIIETKRIRK